MTEASATIERKDRIPFVQKIAFSAGQNMHFLSAELMTGQLWMPFFNIGLGINPVIMGVVLMVLRAWDALTDPVMGHISDNARTRWGRRRPFILVGAITTALIFPLIWYFPSGLKDGSSWLMGVAAWLPIGGESVSTLERATAIHLILLGMLFFTSYTVWSMPYFSLQMELTPDYDERTRLTAWMTLFGKVSSLVGVWILAFVVFSGLLAAGDPKALEGKPAWIQNALSTVQPWLADFAKPQADEKPLVVGMRVAGWLIALSIACFGVLPALFVKERYYAAESSRQTREPFWHGIRDSLRCGPLWSLIVVSFFLILGSMTGGTLGQYVNFYYVSGGDLSQGTLIAGLKGTVSVLVGIASLPCLAWLGSRHDKRTMVMSMLVLCIGGHLLNFFLMTPEHPYWQIMPGAFESLAISAVWMFLPSMKADVSDWDEHRTLRRREGSINAFYAWFVKIALACSMGIGGVVLQLSGFDAHLPKQPDPVLKQMFHMYLLLPVVFWVAAIIAVRFYPLTRVKAATIRTELEARRGFI